MSSSRGIFENEEDYQKRVSKEASERLIKDQTGLSPDQGLFETDKDYRDRISFEAMRIVNKKFSISEMPLHLSKDIVKSGTGLAPDTSWFESTDQYRSRIDRKAREIYSEKIRDRNNQGSLSGLGRIIVIVVVIFILQQIFLECLLSPWVKCVPHVGSPWNLLPTIF